MSLRHIDRCKGPAPHRSAARERCRSKRPRQISTKYHIVSKGAAGDGDPQPLHVQGVCTAALSLRRSG
eukprot:3174959-Alexandrium_andersonii.AAC.1